MTAAQVAELDAIIAHRRGVRARREAHEARLRQIRAEADRKRVKEVETIEQIFNLHDQTFASSLSVSKTLHRRRPADLLARNLRRQIETDPRSALDPRHATFAEHVRALCRRYDLHHEQATNHRYGCAWIRLRVVRFPPVRTGFSYATGLHEIAHVVIPECNHPRVPMSDGRMCCAICELRAWEWAIRTAIAWPPDAQENLTEALPSYRQYADPVTAAAIDALSGRDGRRHARVLRFHAAPNHLDK